MTDIFNKRDFTDTRRALRNSMPPTEHVLWSILRGKQIDGLKFRRQYGIGPYVVDFYCVEIQLAIEVDGSSHTSQQIWQRDQERQQYIESLGIAVLRLTNTAVQSDINMVIEQIWTVAQTLKRN